MVFPYALEVGATGVRRCGSVNAEDRSSVQATCRYDAQGRPIYSAYLSLQLPLPPNAPYFPCTKGYQGTIKYTRDGTPLKGGAKENRDSPMNSDARAPRSRTDPSTPLVRGAQNVTDPSSANGRPATAYGLALYDPASGTVVSTDGSYRLSGAATSNPPSGAGGLAWLYEQSYAVRESTMLAPRRSWIVPAVLVALVLALLGTSWAISAKRGQTDPGMLVAAQLQARNFFSLDYRHADADVDRVLALATGNFKRSTARAGKEMVDERHVQEETRGHCDHPRRRGALESRPGSHGQVLVGVDVATSASSGREHQIATGRGSASPRSPAAGSPPA